MEKELNYLVDLQSIQRSKKMTGTEKQYFIETWECEADTFSNLFFTAKNTDTMKDIEEKIKDLKVLIRQVADEGYQADSSKE